MQNDLDITAPLQTAFSQFHGRPFPFLYADRFAEELRAAITSDEAQALPVPLGGIDQSIDSTDVLDRPQRLSELGILYQ